MSYLGRRYLRAKEFMRYASDLGLLDSPFAQYLLEFLEAQRMLVPVCRVRVPDEIARRGWLESNPDGALPELPIEPDGERWDAAIELARALRMWGTSNEPGFHPLEYIDPKHQQFIDYRVANTPYRPWDDLRPLVGQLVEGYPIYDSDAVDTYYHYWQIFVLAEVLGAGRTIVMADPRRLDAVPPTERLVMPQPFRGSGEREIRDHVGAFESVSIFLEYRSRYWRLVTEGCPVGSKLDAARASDAEQWERACAEFALRWTGLDVLGLLQFIGWQLSRWVEWRRYGPPAMTEEYKRNVVQSVYLYQVLTRNEFDQVLAVLGPDGAILDVMLPDWIKEQQKAAFDALRRWTVPELQPLATVGHSITVGETGEFAQWLSAHGLLQFLLVFAQLADVRRLDSRVRPAVLAKTVEGLGSTLEHILNELATTAPTKPGRDLRRKLRWIWADVADISVPLAANWPLTQTDPGFTAQWTAIEAVTTGTPWEPLLVLLLKAGLVRNQGSHRSLGTLDEEQLYECLRVLLKTSLLVWKHGRVRGWI